MFKGLVGLITGGASGLGRATAEHLVKQGGRVVICDLPSSSGKKVAKEIGSNAIFVPTDVTSEQDVENAIKITSDKFKSLNVAINCAGISMASKTQNLSNPFDYELFLKIMDVNLIGVFNVIRLSAGLIGKNTPNEDGERGVIINTCCLPSLDRQTGQAAYLACKGGVSSMTLPIARDLGNQGIRVVSIAPGALRIPMIEMLSEDDVKSSDSLKDLPSEFSYSEEFAFLIQAIIENPMLNAETIRLADNLRVQL